MTRRQTRESRTRALLLARVAHPEARRIVAWHDGPECVVEVDGQPYRGPSWLAVRRQIAAHLPTWTLTRRDDA